MVTAAAAVSAAAVAVAAAAVTVATAAVTVAAADASATAAVARGAVKPTAVDTVRGAAKPIAVDGVCREHCHGLRGPAEPRRRAPGRRLAALHPWPGHGCPQHLRCSCSSPRPEPGLPPVNRGQYLSSIRI